MQPPPLEEEQPVASPWDSWRDAVADAQRRLSESHRADGAAAGDGRSFRSIQAAAQASACPPINTYVTYTWVYMFTYIKPITYIYMSAPPAHSPASPEETVCIICMDEPRAMPRSCMAIRATFAAVPQAVCSTSNMISSRPQGPRVLNVPKPHMTSSSGCSRKPQTGRSLT
jgi:hypothetical protein